MMLLDIMWERRLGMPIKSYGNFLVGDKSF
jgi:hypothetical protein